MTSTKDVVQDPARETRRKPTDAELAILRVLWTRGPSTVREVAEAMGREGAYTTVLKLMQIMTDKGLVKRDDSSRTHVYKATSSEDQTQRQLVTDLLDKVFGGSAAKLVLRALADGKVSSEELTEIRKLLDARRGGGTDESPWIDVAGWTLLHFLWEGAAIASSRWCCSSCAPSTASPQTRYVVACVALVAMAAAPLVTAAVLSRSVATTASQSADPECRTSREPDCDSRPGWAVDTHQSRHGSRPVERGRRDTPALAPGCRWSCLLWIVGVSVLLLRLFGGWWRIHRLHRASRAAVPSAWTGATARIAATLGLSRRVHVVDSPLVDTPTVIGWMKPVILLPIAAFAGLSPSQVDAILAHELAHIRRHDFLVNLLQTFAETMLFYHPAVWWLSARIRSEREHCCDLVALVRVRRRGQLRRGARRARELANGSLASGCRGDRRHVTDQSSTSARRARRRSAAIVRRDGHRRRRRARHLRRRRVAISSWPRSRMSLGAAAQATASDPAAWSMIFNHADSTMRFIGFRGRDLIRFAYQIPEARVIGGPRWLDEQILKIVVNLDAAPRADEMPGIVREALEAASAIEDARGEAQLPGAGAGHGQGRPRVRTAGFARREPPVLRPAAVDCCGATSGPAPGVATCAALRGRPRQLVGLDAALVGDDAGLRGVPARLRARVVLTPREPHVRRDSARMLVALKAPDIVDRTGLRGRYDVEFSAFYPTAALMSRFPFLKNVFEPMGFTSIPRALEDQLGLALVESEAPYDVIVIDQAERP